MKSSLNSVSTCLKVVDTRRALFVHIHADIFSASHKRVFLSGEVEANTQTLLQKGRPLYCVALLWPDTPHYSQFSCYSPLVGTCQAHANPDVKANLRCPPDRGLHQTIEFR